MAWTGWRDQTASQEVSSTSISETSFSCVDTSSWVWPTRPWQEFIWPLQVLFKVLRFFFLFFFATVNAHPKWPEVFLMSRTTARRTIALQRQTFASYGLPEQAVMDNALQFFSEEFTVFTTFLRLNGVKHVKSAPYHPASNGQADRFV